MTRLLKVWVLVGLAMLVSACGTLPNARPFSDASSALSSSVKASGQAVADSLRDAGGDTAALADRLQAAWQARIEAMQGIVAYADAIADLVAAGKEGGETAKKVGDAVGALAASAGIAIAAPVASVLSDAGRFLADRIAIVRSSQALEDAVTQAQPAVDRVAQQLADDLDQKLKPILKDAFDNTVSQIKQDYADDNAFAKLFDARRQVLGEAALQNPKNVAELIEFDQLRQAVTVRLGERDQKIGQASSAYKARLQLVGALSTATATWSAAHRDLASAIRDKRTVNVAELQDTVAELKDLIKKVRTL